MTITVDAPLCSAMAAAIAPIGPKPVMSTDFPARSQICVVCTALALERQQAATEQVDEAQLVLVVGDERSNNSRRLVQVVQEIAHIPLGARRRVVRRSS